MRPKKHEMTGSGDLFRARLEQIINMKHELVRLAGKIDWEWIDGEIAPLYSDKGRPGIETRSAIGLLLLKHIYGLSDEGVCERWVHDPYFRVPRTLAGDVSGAVLKMGEWPPGAVLQGQAPNRLMLLRLKGVVVSDEEKAAVKPSGE